MSINYATVEKNIVASRELNEANLRKQLAYLYRIFDYYEWSDLIVTHLSVRVPNEEALLILPFGVSFNEITPENLIKVDFDGKIIDSPAGFDINHNGTTAHRAIYKGKPEINCMLHTHSQYGVAVSNLEENFLMLDQISMMFHGKVGYHDFEKLFINDNVQNKLAEDIKGKNSLILKNHGLLTIGKTIAEAFWFHYYLENSCKVQILTMSAGSKIKHPSIEVVTQTAANYEKWRDFGEGATISDSELLFDAAKRKVGYVFG